MSRVDISQWGEILISDLFEHIERGKGSGARSFFDGETPYIAASFTNNGYVRDIDDADGTLTSDDNCIAMIVNGNGGIGRNTYQAEPFVGSSDLQLGYHHKLNQWNGLFLVACLNKSIERYNYSFAWKRTGEAFAKETIFLPILNDGSPDWDTMERYMRRVIEKQENRLAFIEHVNNTPHANIDISKWKTFRVGDLFNIRPTQAYKATNHQLFSDFGKNPVVVNSSFNNGVGGYTERENTEPGQIITFSDTTTSDAIFYQPKPFVGYSHIQGLYPKGIYQNKWNKLNLLFFMTCFRKVAQLRNFSYGDKFTRKLAAEFQIKLPTDPSGNPDWDYMESTMKKVLAQKASHLDALQQLLPPSDITEVP